MIISHFEYHRAIKLISFNKEQDIMADQLFMYAVTTGIFVFLVAILFGSRAKRYNSGWTPAGGNLSSGQE
jgi:hypothetical protein